MKPISETDTDATKVYYWCTGQDDNIGDVVLRRRLLQELVGSSSATGSGFCIYVGSASQSFIEGLAIPREATIYTAKYRWYLSLLKQAILRRPPVLIFNPGEVQRNRNTILAYALLMLPAVAVRLRGGAVLRTGIAVDHRGAGFIAKVATAVVRFTSLLVSEATWRDSASSSEFKTGSLVPDWAIDVPSLLPIGGKRDVIAVTFRSDRPEAFDANAVSQIRRLAELRKANVTVFCQVRRDRTAMERLSKKEGWNFIDWPPNLSHNRQEQIVRELFSKSVFVCSNRIHALIIGLTEGAQAICISSETELKVRTHLEHFGLAIVLDANAFTDYNELESRVREFAAQSGQLVRASAEVSNLAVRVRASIGTGG
ncbi:polysaccharide pyruvyl transferase family protein [Rhodococcus sp. 15-649-2-2]|uniref:polysaccharide pyruvyl transferase family protein n=1 Tax=Rhodococcus sp. 15-649-2-2 TaxID=2023140 RepID=UPI00117B0C60|nr:polysaccharide pyruvyl transferase family protein [Rhodococcus sp. 15-649-2-2]